MADFTYRDATPADAPLMARIGPQTFTETFGHLYTPENLAAFLDQSQRGKLADRAGGRSLSRSHRRAGRRRRRLRQDRAAIAPDSLPFAVEGPAAELKQFYVLRPWQGAGLAQALMDWVLGEARRRGAAELLPLGFHRQSPRPALLCPLWIRRGRQLRLHGRNPCRRGHHHAAETVTVEIRRAMAGRRPGAGRAGPPLSSPRRSAPIIAAGDLAAPSRPRFRSRRRCSPNSRIPRSGSGWPRTTAPSPPTSSSRR